MQLYKSIATFIFVLKTPITCKEKNNMQRKKKISFIHSYDRSSHSEVEKTLQSKDEKMLMAVLKIFLSILHHLIYKIYKT